MLIECVIDRVEPVVVPIGNETYHFEPDALGRKVAEVWKEDHIECFLAVKHLYRPVAALVEVSEPEPEPTQIEAEPTQNGQGGDHDLGPVTDLPGLRAEYKRVTGKNPFMGWNAATLAEKIKAAG